MVTFADQLREWQFFYATVATASATLTGLLFVSLSLNRNNILGKENEPTLRIAKRSFGDLLYVLMMALVFLVPHQVPFGLATALFALGMARVIGLVREMVNQDLRIIHKLSLSEVVREYALPILANLGFIIVSIEILIGNYLALYSLVIVIAALLTTASWNAWLLLIQEK
jgi:hypothetical protein